MVDEVHNDEAREKIAGFNALLEQFGFAFRVDIVAPREPQAAPKNARFMRQETFQQLVRNIQRDKGLTSLPFCWRDAEGNYHILSGHHRIEAALAAGHDRIMILYTDALLNDEEKIAIQLSHNALAGEDEPTVLRELWGQIKAIQWKQYSGLDDALLNSYKPIQIASLGEKTPGFQEVYFSFFPSEMEKVDEFMKRLGGLSKKRYAGRLDDFDRFIEMLLNFKEASGIYNSATAMLSIMEIVEAWLVAQADQVRVELEESNGEAEKP